jgi:competence protein ComER
LQAAFIGTGSMGSILIESFVQSGALPPQDITVTNRSREKAETLAKRIPGLRIADSNHEAASGSPLVFVCVKPFEYKKVIDEIRHALLPEQILVSITSPVMISQLEEELPCKIAKIIPSITNYVLSGATLCIYGRRMDLEDQLMLEDLMGRISTPLRVTEQYTRVTSDISSCGPAFFSLLLHRFVEAAVDETGIPKELAVRLASEMLLGTGKLLTQGGMTPETLMSRVAVPGGITAEGLRLIDRELSGMFHSLIQITHAKYYEDIAKLETLFIRLTD